MKNHGTVVKTATVTSGETTTVSVGLPSRKQYIALAILTTIVTGIVVLVGSAL